MLTRYADELNLQRPQDGPSLIGHFQVFAAQCTEPEADYERLHFVARKSDNAYQGKSPVLSFDMTDS